MLPLGPPVMRPMVIQLWSNPMPCHHERPYAHVVDLCESAFPEPMGATTRPTSRRCMDIHHHVQPALIIDTHTDIVPGCVIQHALAFSLSSRVVPMPRRLCHGLAMVAVQSRISAPLDCSALWTALRGAPCSMWICALWNPYHLMYHAGRIMNT